MHEKCLRGQLSPIGTLAVLNRHCGKLLQPLAKSGKFQRRQALHLCFQFLNAQWPKSYVQRQAEQPGIDTNEHESFETRRQAGSVRRCQLVKHLRCRREFHCIADVSKRISLSSTGEKRPPRIARMSRIWERSP
jgi:hypothetical protein